MHLWGEKEGAGGKEVLEAVQYYEEQKQAGIGDEKEELEFSVARSGKASFRRQGFGGIREAREQAGVS